MFKFMQLYGLLNFIVTNPLSFYASPHFILFYFFLSVTLFFLIQQNAMRVYCNIFQEWKH